MPCGSPKPDSSSRRLAGIFHSLDPLVVERNHFAPAEHTDQDTMIIFLNYRQAIDVSHGKLLQHRVQILSRGGKDDLGSPDVFHQHEVFDLRREEYAADVVD